MNLESLKKEQIELSSKVSIKDSFNEMRTIAGCDQLVKGDDIYSCVVVCDFENLSVIEKSYANRKVNFPYIPGFLAYRETPVIIDAFSKLEKKPDLLLVDGNGILHPRRFGIACYLGITLNIPTIGIAKKLLIGRVENERIFVSEELRGIKLEAKIGSNPIYVSPGHKISVQKSFEIAKNCIRPPHKLPEPLHLAHKFVNRAKNKEKIVGKNMKTFMNSL